MDISERSTEGRTGLAGLPSAHPFTQRTLLNLPFLFCLCYLASFLLLCNYQMCLRAELCKMGATSHMWQFKFKLTKIKSNGHFSSPVTLVTFLALHSHHPLYYTLSTAESLLVLPYHSKIILNSNKGAQLSIPIYCLRWVKLVTVGGLLHTP